MDPISLLLAALTFGATEAAKASVGEAVKDGYRKLKERLSDKLGAAPERQVALEGFQSDQDTWEKPLRKALRDVGADKDEEILNLAAALRSLDATNTGQQVYQTTFGSRATGNAVGTGASATTYINTDKK